MHTEIMTRHIKDRSMIFFTVPCDIKSRNSADHSP